MSKLTIAEINRNIRNIGNFGIISSVNHSNGMVKVAIADGIETDWLPLAQVANSYVKIYIPPRAGEQVIVINPHGQEAGKGIVIRSFYNNTSKVSNKAKANATSIEFSDGTLILKDNDKLSVKHPTKLVFDAPHVVVKSTKIELGQEGLADNPLNKIVKTQGPSGWGTPHPPGIGNAYM